ncbi:MAG: T9SS type A sorting domain-containing protein [bacterium]
MKRLAITTAAALTALAAFCAWGEPPFGQTPDWESADERATNEIALADFNGDGWRNTTGERSTGNGKRHVFYLKHYPALTITAIRVAGKKVPRGDYCFDSRAGWFSLKEAPAEGAGVKVDYKWSNRLDFFAGNETRSQTDNRDVIYFNRDGALEKTPSWLSTARVDTWTVKEADYDADGDVDVAIGCDAFIKVYKNTGSGLERAPSWSTSEPGGWPACFAWGDVDNDGYLELAVADSLAQWFYVFKNNGGTLEKTPSWTTNYDKARYVAWGDADGDGDMDLAGGTSPSVGVAEGFVYLFKNNNGSLAKTHYWKNDPPAGRCHALAWGDVNDDGWLDLVKGICGRATGYDPYADIYYSNRGVLPKKPSWESDLYTHCCASFLVDADADGLLDLIQAVGSGVIGYFSNGAALPRSPSWKYTPGSPYGIMDARVGDVDADRYPDVVVGCDSLHSYPTGGRNKLFLNRCDIGIDVEDFGAAPCRGAVALRWGVSVAVAGFNLLRETGDPSAAAGRVKINEALITGRSPYRYLDADAIPGTPYRYWLEVVPLAGPAEFHGPVECTAGRKASFALDQNVPNPVRAATTIAFSVPAACDATLALYDLAGRKVASRVVSAKAGANEVEVDLSSLAPGVYTYRLEAGGEAAAKRMVVVR